MVLTTAMPGGARSSRLRVNHRQSRSAGNEREGKRGEQDELLHGRDPSSATAAVAVGESRWRGNTAHTVTY
jgi:hypothetical protein